MQNKKLSVLFYLFKKKSNSRVIVFLAVLKKKAPHFYEASKIDHTMA